MDEDQAIALAREGDLDAFNHLVLRYQDLAFNAAYRIMGNYPAAEDATQEAVISMCRKLNSYRGGSFKSWFLRIVTNACYDELRRQKRRPTVPLEPENPEGELIESPAWLEDPSGNLEEGMSEQQIEEAIQCCLQQLDAKFRSVLVLVDISGQDYDTVAQAVNCPVGTVKSRLARARAKMQSCLRGFGELLPAKYRLNSEDDD